MNKFLKASLLCTAATAASVSQAQETLSPASAQQEQAVQSGEASAASSNPSVVNISSANEERDTELTSSRVADSDVIVVTARRRDENLQDVPASVSVLTTEALERTGARQVLDFAELTSGVTMQVGATEPGDASINIRGLNGARDAENNVALVIDGVLRTSAFATTQPQGAISQVEIIKGPQGALYGRNASAGAIVITTQKPTDYLSGQIKASAANDSTYLVSGLLSGPITDQVGFTVNAEYSKSDGFYRNAFLQSAVNQQVYPGNSRNAASIDNYEKFYAFGRLLIAPSDDTEIDIKVNYGRQKAGAINYNAVFHLPGLAQAFNDPVFDLPVSDHEFVFTNNTESESWQKSYGGSVRLSQELDFGSLIGFAAYSNIRSDFIGGGTSGAFGFFANEPNCIATRAATAPAVSGLANQEPFTKYYDAFGYAQPYSPSTCDGIQYNDRRQKDVVTELRLVSPDNGAPLSWQIGSSYIYIDRRVCINLTLDTGLSASRECYTTDPRYPTESLVDDNFVTDVYALFGSVEYEATDKLTLGLALRYDIEARNTSNNVPVNARTRWVGNARTGFPTGTADTPANYYLNPGLDPAYNPSGVLAPRSKTFKQLQPKLSLTYKANDDTTLFANWGIGFKAGGFNNAGTEAIVNGYFNAPVSAGGINAGLTVDDIFEKEVDSAYEVGIKGRLFDSLSYELVGYYTDVTDMQFFEFFVGEFGLLRSVSNIDKVRILGAETSLKLNLAPGYSIFATANYTDSKIKKNSSRPYTVGNKSPYTPDYTINLGAEALEPINDYLDFTGRVDVRVTGPTPFHTVQNNNVPTIFGLDGNYKNSTRKTFTTVDVRSGIESDSWSITAFVSNLFNQAYLNDDVVAPEFGGDFVAPGNLRRYGIEAMFKF
ncbi:TonB-dependent receptor [Parasphingorhabdus sp.]|uniref:TonB-dependent receptor n=1 Tax=Parasphingorhabdus sp. TaxID=2709688 RepID=UPI003001C300|tara:strand:- start:28108 stop:30771 length:2664 start_codon:yes stop_codon:yes gene_type:complete